MSEDADKAVHEALGLYLEEGEIAVAWTLTIDVAGPDGVRYLAHRAGGGADGTDKPMVWAALGMISASKGVAQRQLLAITYEPLEDEEDDDEE